MGLPEPKTEYDEIACQQVLAEDSSVFSIQWVTIPAEHAKDMTTDRLLQLYLTYIRQFTFSLVRPITSRESVEFRLLNTRIPLIKFSSPLHEATGRGTRAILRIAGGVLVQPKKCDRGEMEVRVEQADDEVRLTLQLSDYCPLLLGSSRPSHWRKWLYRLTQAYIHKVVTIRFLARVYEKIEGVAPKTKVVKVTLREGEET